MSAEDLIESRCGDTAPDSNPYISSGIAPAPLSEAEGDALRSNLTSLQRLEFMQYYDELKGDHIQTADLQSSLRLLKYGNLSDTALALIRTERVLGFNICARGQRELFGVVRTL